MTENANTETRGAKILQWLIMAGVFLFPVFYLMLNAEVKKETILPQMPMVNTSPNDIVSLESAAAGNPSFDNLLNLSVAYINNNMPGKSIKYLKKAVELNPQSALPYNDLGVAYTMIQQYQNGIDACAKALQIDGDFQLAKNNLNWAVDEKNKVVAVIRVQELTPDAQKNTDFYIDYGMNNFKIGLYDKAIRIWKKALELEPQNTVALNNIGTALMMKNQIDDAIAAFEKILEIDPNNQLAKNNLAWAAEEKSRVKS